MTCPYCGEIHEDYSFENRCKKCNNTFHVLMITDGAKSIKQEDMLDGKNT